jgi:hypothetical protein
MVVGWVDRQESDWGARALAGNRGGGGKRSAVVEGHYCTA